MYARLNLSYFFLKTPDFVLTLIKTKSIAEDLNSIFNHPFNQQLFDGSLPSSLFAQYLRDDYSYLHHYALALELLSQRIAPTNDTLAKNLSSLATGIISNEQNMQDEYKKYFKESEKSPPSEAIPAYINFIDVHVNNSKLPVALCSILPCFWIYYQLGVKGANSPQLKDNIYKNWIDTYSSPEFINATLELAEAVNQLASTTDKKVRQQMQKAFNDAVAFELKFFNEVKPAISSALTFT